MSERVSDSPFEGMPLCIHRIQFGCEQCKYVPKELKVLPAISEKLYDALKAVQVAEYLGNDLNDVQIEEALQAWERRNL